MKKATSLTLVGLLLFSILVISPNFALAGPDKCYDEYETCRTRGLHADKGIIKTTLLLTICDLAVGTCLIANAIRR